ncbi:MAG TPA: HEAT repeat domain-containing protein [Pirellulales bacterium]|jgi:putative heme-binding domain-containing protein|nr:HEAT repeat domain-containing protein [Pirellulales bacterium]
MDVTGHDLTGQGARGCRWTLVFALSLLGASSATAQNAGPLQTGEAEWIWSATLHGKAPAPVCLFRKTFEARNIESAKVQITCDDRFELHVNGRPVAEGTDWKVLNTVDITKYLNNGVNVLAVRAENTQGNTAGLMARVLVKSRGATAVSYSTDRTWRVRNGETSGWLRPQFNDVQWAAAHSLGEFGATAPWHDQVQTVDGSHAKRFSVTRDFRVERVVRPELTGSVIAMAFNEWGELLISSEGSGLLLVTDKDKDGVPETVSTYCGQVKNCQGILPLNGEVFAVGDGPQGPALYRLTDENQDSKAEGVRALWGFNGPLGEHGPHAVTLGPEGMLYVMIGNHSSIKRLADPAAGDEAKPTDTTAPYGPQSPYHHWYEGDLLVPKYEDANGHAVGVKAPCGTVVRTNLDGTVVELFAGGLRNAYDMAFDKHGELWTYDSDMEWDVGLPWYRPTRLYHVVPGAEFGSRSGWSPWPDYFVDNLPAMLETDRGSPTGVEVYNHRMYPTAYHGAIFLGDWSQGRILVIRTKPTGGSYEATGEVFLEGRPLNVTDLAVGPEGWLYFCTGGRGTEGGVYRVVWTGQVPPQPKSSPIVQALRQPQQQSAWGRQGVALMQEKMGTDWNRQLPAVAIEATNQLDDRVRALDLMQLYGPPIDTKLISKLAHDTQAPVRAKAAYLAGVHVDKSLSATLVQLLSDTDALVRRRACEAIARGGYDLDPTAITSLLADADRSVVWSARRAMQSIHPDRWRTDVMTSDNIREFIEGSTALLALETDAETSRAVIARGRKRLRGYVSDDNFIDLMRVFQLALVQAQLAGDDVAELRTDLAREYPTSEARMNRELIRLLCYLQTPEVVRPLLAELKGKAPPVEKLHAALCARYLNVGWTSGQKLELLAFYEQARRREGGYSYAGYIDNVSKDFFASFDDTLRQQVLAHGERWPNAALNVLATVENPSPAVVAQLIELDGKLRSVEGDEARKLQVGTVAVLSSSNNAEAMAYLRRCFEAFPERREELAMGLAQSPGGDNWPLLVRSLPVVEGVAAQEVLVQLTKADEATTDAGAMRQVILCGLKLKDQGGSYAAALLNKWSGQAVSDPSDPWDVALGKWQAWYNDNYPNQQQVELPAESQASKWSYQELLAYLQSDEAQHAQPVRGAKVFEKAQCIKCHRHSGRGEGIGPDLSTIGQRFQRKEILQSIMFPSQVVSDQYASKTVVTDDGLTYTGIVGAGSAGSIVVLQSNGEKVVLDKENIEQIEPSRLSVMPEGLLDRLTLEEIGELFAYMTAQPSRVTQRPR